MIHTKFRENSFPLVLEKKKLKGFYHMVAILVI